MNKNKKQPMYFNIVKEIYNSRGMFDDELVIGTQKSKQTIEAIINSGKVKKSCTREEMQSLCNAWSCWINQKLCNDVIIQGEMEEEKNVCEYVYDEVWCGEHQKRA